MNIFESVASALSDAGTSISNFCFLNFWLYEEEMPDCLKEEIE